MKSRRPVRRTRSVLFRIAGYAGTTALVAAAVVVLLLPLLDDGKGGTAGAQGSAGPASTAPGGQPGVPGGAGPPGAPTGPAPQGSARPEPGGAPGGQGGGQGGGPQLPDQGGSDGITWCPGGTASYRSTRTGVDVVVTVSSSGAIRAELVLRGRAPESQQTTVSGGGRPHTFHFRGVAPRLVERVKVTTVSVGVSMQTCYARVGA